MLCQFCTDEEGNHLPCQKTLLPYPVRLDRILVRIGHWECDQCGWTKPIYQKQPDNRKPDDFKTISCHCCNDSGSIHHYLVQEFIFPDYGSGDPPVPCKRCISGIKIGDWGWDIATKSDCDRIHKVQLSKIKFSEYPEDEFPKDSTNFREQIISLSAKMSLKHQL